MSEVIKTSKDVIQALRSGWENETIIKNAVTSSGESVRALISKHSHLQQELSDVESKISKFAKVLGRGADKLENSDDSEDWSLAYRVSDIQQDLAHDLGYTGYDCDEGWVNSDY